MMAVQSECLMAAMMELPTAVLLVDPTAALTAVSLAGLKDSRKVAKLVGQSVDLRDHR